MADTPPTPSTDSDPLLPMTQPAQGGTITQEFPDTEGDAPAESVPRKRTAQSATIPLPELGSQLLPSLQDGTLVGGRYQAVTLLNSTPHSNIYDAVDQQGYLRCWACGSDSSEEGDVYCVECGAQMTGRHYHLQEFRLSTDLPADGSAPVPVPQAFLNNEVQGVAHVYNTLQDAEGGRAYIVWEAVMGSTLNSLAAGVTSDAITTHSGQSGALGAIDEERAIVWMAQAAEVLVRLHSADIVGCALTGDNMVIQPGDRLMLVDPSGCRAFDPTSKQEPSEQLLDVLNLVVELEHWYLSAVPASTEVLQEGAAPSAPAALAGGEAQGQASANAGSEKPVLPVLPVLKVLARAKALDYASAEEFLRALEELTETALPPYFHLVSGRASDLGLVRQINEDSVLTIEAAVLEHEKSLPVGLYVIADGMGGHENGEVASSVAVRTIGGLVNSALIGPLLAGDSVPRDPTTCGTLLRQAVLEANRRITTLAAERNSDLGTTVVAALVVGNHVTLANVGDSRAYSWHEGQIAPITQDHSLVAQLVAAGQISPEEIYTHPRRNEIFRALGDARLGEEEVDIYHHRLQPGGGLLLCSDGLWDFVRDATIAGTLSSAGREDPQAICEMLINQANAQGGEDNISAIFVLVSGRGA